jgi:hypothetical protein
LHCLNFHKFSTGGYAEVVNDLDALGTVMTNKSITFVNFEGRITTFLGDAERSKQGVHGFIKEIIENPDLYANKTLEFEKGVANIGGTTSRIDIYTNHVPPLLVERKWYAVSKLDQSTFIGEFIERDLYHATSLGQIRWSVLGNKPTKTQIVNFLSSTEAVRPLTDLLQNGKLQSFFPTTTPITNNTDFINEISKDNIFNEIFK